MYSYEKINEIKVGFSRKTVPDSLFFLQGFVVKIILSDFRNVILSKK